MNNEIAKQICELYKIGNLVNEVVPIMGGLTHRMWKIVTNSGSYAVKELNNDIANKTHVIEELELSEVIANKMYRVGIPVAKALSISGTFVQKIEGITVITYDFVSGKTLSTSPAFPDQCFNIGKIIGNIHTSQVSQANLQTGIPAVISSEHWNESIALFKKRYPDTNLDFDKLDRVKNDIGSAVEHLRSNLVIGHGDIDQKNVIWKDGQTPIIIDWESVSMTNPNLEIVDAALNWAGLVSGTIQIECMKAVMDGYKSVGLKLNLASKDILNSCILKWMSWLDANLRKEDDSAFLQVTNTVRSISLIVEKFELLEPILDSYSY